MKSKKKESSPLSIIISTIVYTILILVLGFSMFANFNKKENEITSFLGYAFAVVQTGSMVDGGFNVGDMVVIREVNTDTLRVGDIIVFYSYEDVVDIELNLTEITTTIDSYVDFTLDDSELNRATKQDAIDANLMLIFHRIINISVDEYGTRFFETKGDSNNTADNKLIREDFVCAKYLQSSIILQTVFTFIASPTGLITVVLIPIFLIAIFQFFSFGKELKGNIYASKLLERKIRYMEIDADKIKIDDFLTSPEKIYLYDISPEEDKPNLAIILWDESVDDVLKVYQKDRDEYYEYFSLEFSNFDKKRLEFLKIKADLIKADDKITEDDANSKAKQILKDKREKEKNENVNNGK